MQIYTSLSSSKEVFAILAGKFYESTSAAPKRIAMVTNVYVRKDKA